MNTIGQSLQKNFIDENYIEVIGEAETEITPDEIYVQITLNDNNKKIRNDDKIEGKMLKALENLGINLKENVHIKNKNSQFNYSLLKSASVYKIRVYEVLVNSSEMVEKIMLKMHDLNIGNVIISKISHSKIEEYVKQTKIKAIKAAREEATSLTEAIGQKIGKAIHINFYEENKNIPQHSNYRNVKLRGTNSVNFDNIEFEKIKIESKICAKFKLL